MGHLYRLTFSNGKRYIGLTKKSVERRFGWHRKASGQTARAKVPLYAAWRKYGEPVCETLCEAPDEHVAEVEQLLIAMQDSMVPLGYNLTAGGEGTVAVPGYWKGKKRPPVSAETRAKMAARMRGNTLFKGKKHTPESVAKMGQPGNQHAKGHRHLEEFKAHMSRLMTGHEAHIDRTIWGAGRRSTAQALRWARALGTDFCELSTRPEAL